MLYVASGALLLRGARASRAVYFITFTSFLLITLSLYWICST